MVSICKYQDCNKDRWNGEANSSHWEFKPGGRNQSLSFWGEGRKAYFRCDHDHDDHDDSDDHDDHEDPDDNDHHDDNDHPDNPDDSGDSDEDEVIKVILRYDSNVLGTRSETQLLLDHFLPREERSLRLHQRG